MGAQTSRVPLPEASIPWHRTLLDPDVSRKLHELSDVKAAWQTGGFLGGLLLSGAIAVAAGAQGANGMALFFTLVYGLQANFLINAMHELGHGFVFRTKFLNFFFMRVVSFLGWLHPDMFFSSHLRHHRFTQHPPLDLENPMPIRITRKDFLMFGFVNFKGCVEIISQSVRAAFAVYPTGHLGWLPGWESTCYPASVPEARAPATRWAQLLVFGHAAIAAVSFFYGLYWLPIVVSFGPFLNGWLFFLCNSSQHVGLLPSVPDFRRNTRTFILHPVIRFFYWQMNFHCEHHMYSAVPCYNLEALHAAIKHDCPKPPVGIIAVWREIAECVRRLEEGEKKAGKRKE